MPKSIATEKQPPPAPPPAPHSPRLTSPRLPEKSTIRPPQCTMKDINRYLCSHPTLLRDPTATETFCNLLSTFNEENASIPTSFNFSTNAPDRLDRLVSLAFDVYKILEKKSTGGKGGQRVVLGGTNHVLTKLHYKVLKTYKVLLRKQSNRSGLGATGVEALGLLVSIAWTNEIAAEGSNALLNMCYDANNVSLLVDRVGVKFIIKFLHSKDVDVQASAAGALQSICFQYMGRSAAKDHDVIKALVPLLASENHKVRDRTIGCLHNLSSDSTSIREIRELGALPGLVSMLSTCTPSACTAAAGTIQNISREPLSRDLLLQNHPNVIEALSNLLFGSDVQGQANAVGALMNLIGPTMEGGNNTTNRKAFKELLSQSIAIGTVWQSVFEEDT